MKTNHPNKNVDRQQRIQLGFTVIELVIVIVILSIISIVTMSRIIGGNSFNAIIVRDQVISLARTAQQNAIGRTNVSMTITPNVGGDLWFLF